MTSALESVRGFRVVPAVLFASACSAPPADSPVQARVPELTVAAAEERVVEGMQCEVVGTLTNSGPTALRGAEFKLTYSSGPRVVTVTALALEEMAVGESRAFQLPYECDSVVGSRRFRAYMGDHPIRLIER